MTRELPPTDGVAREPTSVVGVPRLIVDAARDQRVTFLAAGVAYYAFVSIIPAILLLLVLVSTVFGEVVAGQLLATTGEFLTPAGEELIASAIVSADGRSGATVVGLVVLLWSTLKVFRGLDTAFLQLYGVEEDVTVLDQLIDAASVVVGIGVGIAAMIAVGALVAGIGAAPLVEAASVLVLPLLLTVVFLPMYYLLPYPEVSVRDALPGASFAATGWTLLQAGFQLYATGAAGYHVYGVIGGVLLLVTWLYIAAIIVLLGAVINVVLAEGRSPLVESGDRTLDASGVWDRQVQHGRDRRPGMNGESDRGSAGPEAVGSDGQPNDSRRTQDAEHGGMDDEWPRGAPDVAALQAELNDLRTEFDAFEGDVRDRTVDKPALESELKGYVRSRMRRGHARGWGPYIVLLYGTVLTLGAFTYLDGIYAIAAMVVLGLSTLGLYTLFIFVGIGLNLLETPGKAIDYARDRGDD